MPARRNLRPRRSDPGALEHVWCQVLECGYDFFGELPALGIATDHVGTPDLEAARAAWMEYGPQVMAAPRHPSLGATWGEQQFGPLRPRAR